jgi:hypothetical protein
MTLNVIEFLKEIRTIVKDKKTYLFGTTIRKILNKETADIFNIFVKIHHAENKNKIFELLPKHPKVFYTLGTSLKINDIFTTNLLYVDIDSIINGNIEVNCFQQGLKDYNKKSLKFTKEAIENIKPEYFLRTIETSIDTDFHIDIKTIKYIFTNKQVLDTLEKRHFYRFLCNSIKYEKTRKYIALCNTLGISSQLLGAELNEDSVLNHLEPNDVPELFSVILRNFPVEHLKSILVDCCGVAERDCEYIVNVSKAFSEIKDETVQSARKFLSIVGKGRIANISRLLRYSGFKELSKNIKLEKEAQVTHSDLCIDAKMIHLAFGIDNQEIVAILLDKALEKIIIEPDFNNQNKILNYLNIERKNL